MFIFKSPQTPLYERGAFYDIAFSGFIGNIFDRVKNGEGLWAIMLPPLFTIEGLFYDVAFSGFIGNVF